jgi:hypothetical protein
MHSIHAR